MSADSTTAAAPPASEQIDLDQIRDDPKNPQDHGPGSVEAIAASLAEFGQQKPVVLDSAGTLIAGHGTVMAARALGWRTLWAVRSKLSGAARSGYQVADNATAQHAEWNGHLAEIVKSIDASDPDMVSALGLTPEQLAAILSDDAEPAKGEGDGKESEDGFVRFEFGDFAGLVDPEVYASWKAEAQRVRLNAPEATVSDIMADIFRRLPNQKAKQ